MNRTTVIMLALALGSAAGAWSMRPVPFESAAFEDTGEDLFADFTDPTQATSLEVVAWDEEAAQIIRFAVKLDKSQGWVIPSHNSYPADGNEQMAKAANSFINVKKDLYYSDDASLHAQFGVLDPTEQGSETEGKGTRITIEDKTGNTAVDVIVGNEIEGKQGYYYVRKPSEKRVYGSQIELGVSTDFADWIEKDMLKVERDDFVRMAYDPYSVNEAEGRIEGSAPIIATVEDETLTDRKAWRISDDSPTQLMPGQTLDSVKVRGMLTSIANLKIAGVRPRPEAPDEIERALLLRKGFFVAQNNALLANEGLVQAVTDDGVVYNLLFGEVTHETGIALTAGAEGAKDEPEGEDEAAEAGEEGEEGEEGGTTKQASRFLMVNVTYNPTYDTTDGSPPPPDPDDPDAEPKLPGPQRAEQLNKRFSKWFYVISDSSFKQIHKERDELFKGG